MPKADLGFLKKAGGGGGGAHTIRCIDMLSSMIFKNMTKQLGIVMT